MLAMNLVEKYEELGAHGDALVEEDPLEAIGQLAASAGRRRDRRLEGTDRWGFAVSVDVTTDETVEPAVFRHRPLDRPDGRTPCGSRRSG
jgi:hypothetical protein